MTALIALAAIALDLLIALPLPFWLAFREVRVPRHGRSRR